MTGADDTPTRAALVRQANRTGCDHAGFLWRLTVGGDGWHCYACEPLPEVENPVRDIELLNALRAPLHVLRRLLTA